MKPLSAIEESLALSEWAMMNCWFCQPGQARYSQWGCVAASAGVDGEPDEWVRVLSRKGMLRTVRR